MCCCHAAASHVAHAHAVLAAVELLLPSPSRRTTRVAFQSPQTSPRRQSAAAAGSRGGTQAGAPGTWSPASLSRRGTQQGSSSSHAPAAGRYSHGGMQRAGRDSSPPGASNRRGTQQGGLDGPPSTAASRRATQLGAYDGMPLATIQEAAQGPGAAAAAAAGRWARTRATSTAGGKAAGRGALPDRRSSAPGSDRRRIEQLAQPSARAAAPAAASRRASGWDDTIFVPEPIRFGMPASRAASITDAAASKPGSRRASREQAGRAQQGTAAEAAAVEQLAAMAAAVKQLEDRVREQQAAHASEMNRSRCVGGERPQRWCHLFAHLYAKC